MKLLPVLALSACVAQQPHPEPPHEPPAEPALVAAAPEVAVPVEDPRVGEARALEVARDRLRGLRITLYKPLHKDGKPFPPSDGYLAPVAPVAGGTLYSGLLDRDGASHLVIGKRDAEWNVVWEITYEKKGFAAYEGGQVGEDAEGNVLAFVPSYVDPAQNPTYRFVKLSANGVILWELQLVRDKWGNSAQVHFGKIAADGSLQVQGHIYQGKRQETDRPALAWKATITTDGTLTDESVGDAIDWATDEW